MSLVIACIFESVSAELRLKRMFAASESNSPFLSSGTMVLLKSGGSGLLTILSISSLAIVKAVSKAGMKCSGLILSNGIVL
jgi:hypothetical protein